MVQAGDSALGGRFVASTSHLFAPVHTSHCIFSVSRVSLMHGQVRDSFDEEDMTDGPTMRPRSLLSPTRPISRDRS